MLICGADSSTAAAKEAMRQIYAKLYVDIIVLGSDEVEGGKDGAYFNHVEFASAASRFLGNLNLIDI